MPEINLIDINELAKRLSIPEGTVSHVTALMSLRSSRSASHCQSTALGGSA
jgi:hypothetical protein